MMISYPISVSADGGLSVSSNPDIDNVLALIETQYYERCMFPDYGLALSVFDAISTFDLEIFLVALNLSLTLWHNFLTEVNLDSSRLDDGVLGLTLSINGELNQIEINQS